MRFIYWTVTWTLFISVFGVIAIFSAGCAATGETRKNQLGQTENGQRRNQPVELEFTTTTFSFDQHESPYKIFSTYKISPGDVLDILYQLRTWVETEKFRLAIDQTISVHFVDLPDLSVTERVRPDGNISLPYLGEIYVAGKTVKELTAELKKQYGTIFKHPELYVSVPSFHDAIREFKRDLYTAPRGLSRLVTVRPDGYATFAMVGDVKVAGRTIPDVARELNEEYQKILPGLGADLFLEEHAGRRVYVLGEVEKPDAYRIFKPVSVIEALAMAGSHLPSSDTDEVAIIRRRGDRMAGTILNLSDVLGLKEDSEFFFLQPDDIVYVPRRRISRWADVTRDIADIMFFRGWGASVSYRLNND